MKKLLSVCSLLCSLLMVATVSAEYRKIGTAAIDTVKTQNINPRCSYRIKGTLATNKVVSYDLTSVKETAGTTFSYTLIGRINYEQLLELKSNPTSLFVTSVPSPGSSPTPNNLYGIQVDVTATAPAIVRVNAQGNLFQVKPSFWELEADCGAYQPLPITGTGSDACPGLSVSFSSPGGQPSCFCPYNSMTSGSNTACNYLTSSYPGSTSPSQTILYTDGSAGYPGSSALPGKIVAKYLGPVGQGLSFSYVFDAASCSCKLCDPNFFDRTVDQRACQCKFTSAADLIAFRNQPVTNAPPNSLPPAGSDTTCGSYSYTSSPAVFTMFPNKIFNAEKCTCEVCPGLKIPNATRSACI